MRRTLLLSASLLFFLPIALRAAPDTEVDGQRALSYLKTRRDDSCGGRKSGLESGRKAEEWVADRIRESLWDEGRNEGVFTLYRRDGLATDLAVHIRHEKDDAEVPSRLGLNLVSALATFGLVKHSVWHEMTEQPVQTTENCE